MQEYPHLLFASREIASCQKIAQIRFSEEKNHIVFTKPLSNLLITRGRNGAAGGGAVVIKNSFCNPPPPRPPVKS